MDLRKRALSEPLQQIDRTYVLYRGRKLTYFGGCDYLRLSSHPKIIEAVRQGIKKFGLNVAASRRTTGNHLLYENLETATRDFFQAEQAVLVSNGYLTNIAAAQGLHGEIDHAFIDERAHASLRDAVKFLGCGSSSFSHRDARNLRSQFRLRSGSVRIAVLTDGMFSHDGSFAPLKELRAAIGARSLLWIDDAHAAGICGPHGRGTVEAAGISRKNLIQTITFSKGFGAYGGAILCGHKTAAQIIRKSTVVAGNTPVPLPFANAALAALNLSRGTPALRARLWRNAARFWAELNLVPKNLSPVVAVVVPNPAVLKRDLLAVGIHPPFIQYPGGPTEGYFRFALASEHSAAQITALAGMLRRYIPDVP